MTESIVQHQRHRLWYEREDAVSWLLQ